MTAVARPESASARASARTRSPLRIAQLRCTGSAPDHDAGLGRCQLLVGHDGPHALMYVDTVRGRTVRSWTTSDDACVDSQTAFQRPWAMGFPAVAWTD